MGVRRGLAGFALLALVLAGCTPHRLYRPDNVQRESDYTLAYIEFDDQGEPWLPLQAERAVDVIRRANEAKSGSVVLVFVHGWNNNASPDQEQTPKKSLNGFKQALGLVAQSLKATYPDSTPPVVGVYVAWRGQSSYSFLKPFTFYGRQRTANRVAGTAATGTLFHIMSATKQNPSSRIVLIGHSFGGLAVEEAVIDVAAGELLGSVKSEVDFPADLVVLINQASASIHAKQFVDLLTREGVTLYRVDPQGRRYERPLVVSVTSETDTATRVLFPVGQTLWSLGRHFRKYGPQFCTPAASQRGYQLYTAGHQPVLHSHIVTGARLPTGSADKPDLGFRADIDPNTREQTISFNGARHRFTIKRKPRAFNDTPYWIMRVPKTLIPDHSDIFGPNTIRLVTALVRASGAVARESRTVLVRETGVRPIGLGFTPAGGLVLFDQLRRVYTLPVASSQPVFIACLPGPVDPAALIGAFPGPESFTVIQRHEVIKGDEKKGEKLYRTELIRMDYKGTQAAKPKELKATARFLAASGDARKGKLYLADAEALYVADLSKKKPRPEVLTKLDTSGELAWIRMDPRSGDLLLPDSGSGRLYAIRVAQKPPRVELLAEGLGRPVDVAVDAQNGLLYVADAKGPQIWRLQCERDRCGAPQVFTRSKEIMAPTRGLAVGPDGTLWVADPKARKIFALGPDGQIRRTIASVK